MFYIICNKLVTHLKFHEIQELGGRCSEFVVLKGSANSVDRLDQKISARTRLLAVCAVRRVDCMAGDW
jgi:predicted NAD/FAD-binding protein